MKKPFLTYLKDEKRRKEEVIPGTYDLVFKHIFTTQKEYLADIINYITGLPREEIINNAEIKNSEYIIENIEESKKTSDIIIEINNNIINLEMNRIYYSELNRRNNKYMHKLSSLNNNQKNIIQINFDDFNENKNNRVIRKYIMMEEKTGEIDKDSLIKYKINLALISEKYYNKEKLNRFEKEILMLKICNKEELYNISKGDVIMESLNNELNKLSDDKYLAMLYDKEEADAERNRCLIKDAINEGIEQGKEEGYLIGEKEKSYKIARNMINMNMSIEDISKATGLSIEEIQKI